MPVKAHPKVIFFDFGDTLVETEPLYIERLRMSFEAEGVKVTYPQMERAYLEADWRSAKTLAPHVPFPVEAWRELFMAVMIQTLGLKLDAREFLRKVADRMAEIHPVRKPVRGAEEFLELCAKSGIRMAVLSNNDGRTRQKAAEVGIADRFEFFMDSTIEGTAKPDPNFFKEAAQRMGVEPKDCLHVGDLLGCDVLGAHIAGLPTVWFQIREHTPKNASIKPDVRVGSFEELARRLKLR